MNESAAAWFETSFQDLLGTSRTPEVSQVIRQLCRATINQHSCLIVESPELRTRLSEQAVIGSPQDNTPLILSEDRLYLARFYHYEREVAEAISQRNSARKVLDPDALSARLDHYFGVETDNRQKLAALMALTRNLAIITGGPGTGKTSTVVKFLNLLLEENPSLNFHLAAPTGKAANRLGTSMGEISFPSIPEVKTLHRLLGIQRDGFSFRHGPDNPIDTDVLIIDEASMIDLPMMHRLLKALKPDTRLILLGDPNQLPSVDTGNVLADLCAGSSGFSAEFTAFAKQYVGDIPGSLTPTLLTDSICELDRSYRFSAASGIGQLSRSIEAGEPKLEASTDITITTDAPLVNHWLDYISLLKGKAAIAPELHSAFEATRILGSRRGGDKGVEAINASIEQHLEQLALKDPDNPFYHGRPILITRNDYNLNLFNGDVGICIAGPDEGYQVVFTDGKEYLASRLPEHETCFAMTVHKSQGSEFDHVVLVLADEISEDAENLVTRELLYTAVTRAKTSITLHTTEERWQTAMQRSATRASGMTSFLAIAGEADPLILLD